MEGAYGINKLDEHVFKKLQIFEHQALESLPRLVLVVQVSFDELVEISALAVLKVHKISFLVHALDDYRLVSLKTFYLNYIWVTTQNLRNLELDFSI